MPYPSREAQHLAETVFARLQAGEHAVPVTEGLLGSNTRPNAPPSDQNGQALARPSGTGKEVASAIMTHPDGRSIEAVLSGSFAPLHEGHRHMRIVAQRWLAKPVHYELSVENADKPRCSVDELARRLAQFSPHDTVWVTRLPTFLDKATLLQPRWFVVGIDTMRRISDLRFYGESEAQLEAAVRTWARCGTKFLVFGRREGSCFRELDELRLPATLRQLCQGVAESEFRHDISSTELREAGEW